MRESLQRRVAAAAAKTLGSKSASPDAKAVAATVLTQTRSSKSTGSTVAAAAARMLRDPKASKADKTVAATALTHRPPKRGQEPLTERQSKALEFIRAEVAAGRPVPSRNRLAAELGLPTGSSTADLHSALVRKGYLVRVAQSYPARRPYRWELVKP